MTSNILITSFPDFLNEAFDIDRFNQQFKNSNIIISALSCNVCYPEHWGPLSIKCSISGNEHYIVNGCRYTVNESNYLLLNEGQSYSSYIYAENPVHSFSISFSKTFSEQTLNAILGTRDDNIDDPWRFPLSSHDFIEKLYQRHGAVDKLIFELKDLIENFHFNQPQIEETFYHLLEQLLFSQKVTQKEINEMSAVKASTRVELYKRLYRAKDYIDSCFMEDISLDKLSSVAHLNSAYFIRQFKDHFNVTPVQYLIQKRTSVAKRLLEETDTPISKICTLVGYNDVTSFGKLFKSFYRFSPNQYRSQSRNQDYCCTSRPIYFSV